MRASAARSRPSRTTSPYELRSAPGAVDVRVAELPEDLHGRGLDHRLEAALHWLASSSHRRPRAVRRYFCVGLRGESGWVRSMSASSSAAFR